MKATNEKKTRQIREGSSHTHIKRSHSSASSDKISKRGNYRNVTTVDEQHIHYMGLIT